MKTLKTYRAEKMKHELKNLVLQIQNKPDSLLISQPAPKKWIVFMKTLYQKMIIKGKETGSFIEVKRGLEGYQAICDFYYEE